MTIPQSQLLSRQTLALAKKRGIGGGIILMVIQSLLPKLIELIMELLSAQPQLVASGATSQPTDKDVFEVIRNTK